MTVIEIMMMIIIIINEFRFTWPISRRQLQSHARYVK